MATESQIPRLSLSILHAPGRGSATIHEPVTCLILQGAKEITIGNTVLRYDCDNYFLTSLDVPSTGEVSDATAERPYLALGLTLHPPMLVDLIATASPEAIGQPRQAEPAGFATSAVTPDLLEAWGRLIDLLDRPDDIAALAPLRERELLYCLLRGPLGPRLRQMAQEDSRLAKIRRAIDWIRANFSLQLRSSEMAVTAGMSVASFFRHFKAATAMTPLQYQKLLRLEAARRLLLSGESVSGAGYQVGYASIPHFSRDYRRLLGTPPSQELRAGSEFSAV